MTTKLILAVLLIAGVSALIYFLNKKSTPKPTVQGELLEPKHYEWSKNANIYEINVRQYSEEGTLNAIRADFPRLEKMGVTILWLMPIHPISVKNRKGTLGSNYAVSDYKAVNPEFGTMEDFKVFVKEAHERGMKVILDWVPNHTGWDHVWIEEHPEYFTKNDKGEIIDPINFETGEPWGWTDVADLDYTNYDLWHAMFDAMKFWVTEANIDGFRCDVAHQVPDDFWVWVIQELRKVDEDIFMLAEGEVPAQRNICGFDMDYAWNFKNYMNAIGEGKMVASDLDKYLKEDRETFQKGYHMYFTTNHDENAWEGTVFERLGDGHLAMAVLAFTWDGMPLIYSGQEAGLDKRLEFFEKDPIQWGDYKYQDFYASLLQFKKENSAIWNGTYGAEPVKVETAEAEDQVYAYIRENDENKVFVILNLSKEPASTTIPGNAHAGEYTELFSGETVMFEADDLLEMTPWEYRVYALKK